MFVCQFLIPCCLTVSIHSSTPETLTLDICLGNYEKYFVKSSGVQVCTVGKSWQKILCMLSVIIHSIFSSNVLDAIFLYIIFTKVKYQTEKSKRIIGEKAYGVRKRYVNQFWGSTFYSWISPKFRNLERQAIAHFSNHFVLISTKYKL